MKESAVLLIDCPDRRGLISRVSTMLYEHGANILHADQHQDHGLGLFFMRVEFALNGAGGDSTTLEANPKPFDLEAFKAGFALMAAELFGVRILGRLMGVILTADGLADAITPMVVGWIYDRQGSYVAGFGLLIALALLGAVAIALLPQRREEILPDVASP